MTASSKNNRAKINGAVSHLSLYAGLLVIVIIAVVVMYSYTNIQYRIDTSLFESIQQQQVLARQIIRDIDAVTENRIEEFNKLREHYEQFGQQLIAINDGIAKSQLPDQSDVPARLKTLTEIWQDYRLSIDAVLARENSLKTLLAVLGSLNTSAPAILLASDEIVRGLVENTAPANDVYIAAHQLVLMQRIANGIDRVTRAGPAAEEERMQMYADIGRDSAIYGQTLRAMLATEKDVKNMRVDDPKARQKLLEISSLYQNVNDSVTNILALEPEIASLNSALRNAHQQSPPFIQASESLANSYGISGRQHALQPAVWAVLGVGLAILLGLIISRTRIATPKRSGDQFETDIDELIGFIRDEASRIAKGDFKGEGHARDGLPPGIIDDISNALEPIRKRAEHIVLTSDKVLSVSRGMHQSVINIVDTSDRLAAHANKASGIVENIIMSSRRMVNDVGAALGQLNTMLNEAAASRDPVAGGKLITENEQLGRHVMNMSQVMADVNDNVSKIGDVAERIGGEASKINLIALNAAIYADGDGKPMASLLAADEIQQHAQRIAGVIRHLTDLTIVLRNMMANAKAGIEPISRGVDSALFMARDEDAIRMRIAESSLTLVEKIQGVATVTDRQAGLLGNVSSSLVALQETIVDLSAGINDIMMGVEGLEKLVKDMGTS